MSLKKTVCWKPKQNAPRITEESLSSEEDHLLLRRLQAKYHCSRFEYKTDPKMTSSFLRPTSAPSTVGDIEIKHEPLTPVCNLGPQNDHGIYRATSPGYRYLFQTLNQDLSEFLKTEDIENSVSNCNTERGNCPLYTQLPTQSSGSELRELFATNTSEAENLDCNQLNQTLFSFTEKETPVQISVWSTDKSTLERESDINPHILKNVPDYGSLDKRIPNEVFGSKRRRLLQTQSPSVEDGMSAMLEAHDFALNTHNLHSVNLTPTRHQQQFHLPSISGSSKTPPCLFQQREPTKMNSQESVFSSFGQSAQTPVDKNIVVHTDEISTWEPGLDWFKTPGPAITKERTPDASKHKDKGNKPSDESVSHCMGVKSKTNKTCRDRIQKKLTTYATAVKKKTAQATETWTREEADESETNTRHSHQMPINIECHKEQGQESILVHSLQCIRDIGIMTRDQRHQVIASLSTSSVVSCLVMYEDGTTNTDSSLFNKLKVKALLLRSGETSYQLPVPQHCDVDTAQWSRTVLKDLLKNEGITKVAINCKQFAIALLQDFSLADRREWINWQFEDPMVAGWLLSPDNPLHTLHALCKSHHVPYSHDAGYHGDLKTCMLVMEKLRSRLAKQSLWPLFRHVEMPLTPLLACMELQAFRINTNTFLTFSQVLKKKLHKVESKAYELAGHSFSITSTQQLRQLLYEELRLDQQLPKCRKMTLTASAHHKSTSEAVLKQLVSVHPLPAVILEHRHLLKLKSTYIDGMLEAMEGGVLRTHWDQTAAATGRLASSQPNLQAIPKTPTTITDFEHNFIVGSESKNYEIYAREPFISNEGNIFLAADFQQIELRLLSHMSNSPRLKDMFHSQQNLPDIFIQLTAQWQRTAGRISKGVSIQSKGYHGQFPCFISCDSSVHKEVHRVCSEAWLHRDCDGSKAMV